MTTKVIRSAPSGPRVEVLVPSTADPPDPTKYLNEAGFYTVPAGSGAVDSVQGSDGITPTTPQTGVVELSGDLLLPRDGSRPMTGNLPMGGGNIVDGGSAAFSGGVTGNNFNGAQLTSAGPATEYLNADGTYSDPIADAGGPFLPLAGGVMSGPIDMDGNELQDAIATGTFNGVNLTAAGAGSLFLADDGTYKAAGGGGQWYKPRPDLEPVRVRQRHSLYGRRTGHRVAKCCPRWRHVYR